MTIELAEALYTIGGLPGEQLPSIAMELLESGNDTPAIRMLAGIDRPTLRDAGEIFESVLLELGRKKLSKNEAAWVLARDLARRVISEKIEPREACNLGAPLTPMSDYHSALMPFYLGDDEYDLSFQQKEEIDRYIVKHCHEITDAEPNVG